MPFEVDLKAPINQKLAELQQYPDLPEKAELEAALQDALQRISATCTDNPTLFEGMHFPRSSATPSSDS